MPLLHRIAVENGDEARKMAANLALTKMAEKQIKDWNASLLAEIGQKLKVFGRNSFDFESDDDGNG